MSFVIDAKTGPYYHVREAKWEKVFPGGRRFTVLVAGAYDAGIIGPEYNGVVVLDENNGCVVLDRHVEIESGDHGPSREQMAEAQRILAMDWSEFAEFCREHPRYRPGSMPDVWDTEPETFPEPEDRRLLDGGALDGAGRPAALRNRLEIIDFLSRCSFHRETPRSSKFRLAWNVKISELDPSVATGSQEYDERWAAYAEQNSNWLFEQACESMSRVFINGDFCTYPGDDDGDYRFAFAGRSSGWLVLTSAKGIGKSNELLFSSHAEYRNWLTELDDKQLVKLYRLVTAVDSMVDNRDAQILEEYRLLRECIEDDYWRQGLSAPMESESEMSNSF